MIRIQNLFEELHYFDSMDSGEDEYDQNNAHQTIMEINRSNGIARFMMTLPSQRKRRLL